MHRLISLVFIVLVTFGFNIQASTLVPGSHFQFIDHPNVGFTQNVDSNISLGIRIDDFGATPILPGTADADITPQQAAEAAFSFNLGNANVSLYYNTDDTVRIAGTVVNNFSGEEFTLEYNLQNVTEVMGPEGGFVVTNPADSSGFLTNGVDTFDIQGVVGNDGTIFRALADGLRCDTPGVVCESDIVATGWIAIDTGNGLERLAINDFFGQLTPVPVPAALPFLITGLLGFSFFSRRKQNA